MSDIKEMLAETMEKRISSYTKICNLGHAGIAELFHDSVLIEEKVDGSQFSFGMISGDLICRSKNKELVLDAPDKMFEQAVDAVSSIQHLLVDGQIYRGEYLRNPKHNTLVYDRVPTNNIIIFDIDVLDQSYMTWERKNEEAKRLGFECVPKIFEGEVEDYEIFKTFLEQDSVLGGCKIEGVVIKNYSRFGRDGKTIMGKFVSEAFKESHRTGWSKDNPTSRDIKGEIGVNLKTEPRWQKAVQHLRDDGLLTDSPKDIGSLMKEVQRDTLLEEEAQIKEQLFNWAKGDISRMIVRGLPQWYKERLAESQFETT